MAGFVSARYLGGFFAYFFRFFSVHCGVRSYFVKTFFMPVGCIKVIPISNNMKSKNLVVKC